MKTHASNTGASHQISSQDSKRHFVRNTASNVAFFVFSAVTSLLMVPYVKNHLGWECFGLVGVAQQFVTYTQVLTVVLMGVFRFVTVSMAKDDLGAARGYLNTQLRATLVFCAAFLPISLAISYFTPVILRNVPPGLQANVQVLFALTYVSFLIGLIAYPYQVGQFVRQRFDIRNGIEVLNQILRYSTWILLFWLSRPSMWHIGAGYILGSIGLLAANVLALSRLTPELRPSFREFSRSKCGEMTRMGGWLVVSQVGVVLYLSIDTLIINQMIGADTTGKYFTILGLALQLRVLSGIMCSLVVPMAIASYARNDWASLVRNSARAVKFVSIGMAVPLAILCGLADPFLTRWLKEPSVVPMLTPLVWLLLAHNVINCGVEPLFSLGTAANKVAVPGIVTVVGGVIKVVLSVVLIKYTNLGLYGVAIAGLISLTLKNAIFTPLYSGRILKCSSRPFYWALMPSILVFAIVAGGAHALAHIIDLATYPRLLASGLLLAGVAGVGIYFLVISNDDRAFLKRLVNKDAGTSE